MVNRYVGSDVALRFSLSLGLVIVIVNVILNIIGDLQAQLVEQAVRDPLTGALNRRQLDTALSDAIERNRRSGAPASLLLFDIDHFKRVNDQLGHAIGDRVLQGLVTLVNKRARQLDALFRIGGEEFMLLLPDTRGREALIVAENVRALVAAAPLLESGSISISIGASELQAGDTVDSWMKDADDALYLAKKAGRNQVAWRQARMGATLPAAATSINAQA
jgi:diguanylate cyclase (GGDEF)-like protein